MICPVHNKEMREGPKGYYCPTPITKSSDGKKVLEWCQYKPDQTPPQSSTYTPEIAAKAAEIREKLPQVGKAPDWEKISEGKVRHGVVVAVVEHSGLSAVEENIASIDMVVSYIMTGQWPQ